MSSRSRIGLTLGLMVCTSSACATYSDKTMEVRNAVQAGRLDQGVDELNRFMKVRSGEDVPKKWKGDTPLAILERGTILHAMGEWEHSARDMQLADQELEMLDLSRDAAGKIGQFIYSDSATKYKAPPVEKLSLNAYNMINYLARGDLQGARVEAKRFSVMRDYLQTAAPERAFSAFGSYLAGFTMEKLGETDSALRYYDEALQGGRLGSLEGPIRRLASRGTYRTPRLEEVVSAGEAGEAPAAEILIVASVGRAPYKIPQRIPIGLAIGIAGTYVTGDPEILARSAFKVVTFPELVESPNLFDQAKVRVDGEPVAVELATDVGLEVEREYEDALPRIIGAAITRMIARALAAEGARAAGNQANEGGAAIGLLAALAVEGTMVALDKPDTRSWTMLPNRVFVARIGVEAGKHRIEVRAQGPGGKQAHAVEVQVPAGGWALVDVTTLR